MTIGLAVSEGAGDMVSVGDGAKAIVGEGLGSAVSDGIGMAVGEVGADEDFEGLAVHPTVIASAAVTMAI
jgi:hypothetical protein